MRAAVDALCTAYPAAFSPASATVWVQARTDLLRARAVPLTDPGEGASSGCAAGGARTHATGLAEDAAHALLRWQQGRAPWCQRCAALLPLERLEAAPAAVTCTGCARPYEEDTKWCR